jgi:hypothetical protein
MQFSEQFTEPSAEPSVEQRTEPVEPVEQRTVPSVEQRTEPSVEQGTEPSVEQPTEQFTELQRYLLRMDLTPQGDAKAVIAMHNVTGAAALLVVSLIAGCLMGIARAVIFGIEASAPFLGIAPWVLIFAIIALAFWYMQMWLSRALGVHHIIVAILCLLVYLATAIAVPLALNSLMADNYLVTMPWLAAVPFIAVRRMKAGKAEFEFRAAQLILVDISEQSALVAIARETHSELVGRDVLSKMSIAGIAELLANPDKVRLPAIRDAAIMMSDYGEKV